MSKSLVTIYFLLSIVVAILFVFQAPEVSGKDPGKHKHYKYTVYMIDGCESGIEYPINGVVHHVGNFSFLRLWDQYHWSFSVSYTKDVVYHCDVKRGYTGSQRRAFVCFDLNRDADSLRCGDTGICYWKITEVGIYFGNNNSTWTRAYNWSSLPVVEDSNYIQPQKLPGSID